ncbi:MAG: AAA family ATPase, partial [Pseudomonadales bacterium]
MIVYSATRKEFSDDVFSNQIAEKIHLAFKGRLHHATSRNEVESWKNSMQYMNNVLLSAETPDDARVGIEYKVPLTSKRLDFILTGMDEKRQDVAVIVELKQWSSATATDKDAIVESFVGGARRELLHPSYQAWSYAALIRDFNETV